MSTLEKRKRTPSRTAVLFACLTAQICVGILYLWSVLNAPVQAHLRMNPNIANQVQSFLMLGFVFGNIIGGFFQDKTNPRLVATIGCIMCSGGFMLTALLTPSTNGLIFLTYSALAGLGCGFVYATVLSTLQKWFPTRRGFASGISAAVFTLAVVVFTPIINALLNILRVDFIFLVFGGSTLIFTMIACFFVALPADITKTINSPQAINLTLKQAFKTRVFWLLFAYSFFFNASFNMLVPIMRNAGQGAGLLPGAVMLAILPMLAGIANTGGRLIMGTVSDKIGRARGMMLTALATVLATLGLIWAGSALYVILVVIIAFAFGGSAAMIAPITVDFCGKKWCGTIFGMLLLSLGLSAIVFTALGTWLYELSGGYTFSFLLAGSVSIISVIIMIIYNKILFLDRKKFAPSLLASESPCEAPSIETKPYEASSTT